ncbi:hypothetical protein [Paenibacillus prosopidis]|uniref:Uncharacterized protein n=1 Tax=Paenibacillus prosopidis TaxID=630520 RepID=A0A368W6Z6_9BACL|nr:hypothetical protein [Paenibacillus prosopidis]RCW48043.1 hypothetical protein DFP97_107245 [Paenibacillus prosopidis]
MNDKERKPELIFWSIALPGFAQLLNGKYVKGILFIALEFLINVNANFNKVILLSFQGEIKQAIEQANYQWLMFYPCLYMFAMWDGYRDVGGMKTPYSFLPFVFTAYFLTVGVIYSSKLKLFGVLLGPVWLPILFLPLGLGVGFIFSSILINFRKNYV